MVTSAALLTGMLSSRTSQPTSRVHPFPKRSHLPTRRAPRTGQQPSSPAISTASLRFWRCTLNSVANESNLVYPNLYMTNPWTMPYLMAMPEHFSTDQSGSHYAQTSHSKDSPVLSTNHSGSAPAGLSLSKSSSPPNLVPHSSSESDN